MKQLTLQDHPQVLAIDGNADNGWEGGHEKKWNAWHYAGALSCHAGSVRLCV